MLIPNTGIYINDGDTVFEAETNYYLHFQIISALVSIEYISNAKYGNTTCFENKAQYYHYYLDHLLYSIGQISERFRVVKNPQKKDVEFNERRKINRVNYNFNEATFPILSNKEYRNTIEHIDEHDINVIISQVGVGGFNYIDEETPDNLKDILLSNWHNHIYTLDLLSGNIYITRNGKKLTLCIGKLKNELIKSQNNVEHLNSFIST